MDEVVIELRAIRLLLTMLLMAHGARQEDIEKALQDNREYLQGETGTATGQVSSG